MAEVSKSRWWTKLRLTFEYADVSADPDAPIWANIAREVRLALLELGFEPLGFAHAWLKIGKAHLVHEVLVSEEGLIQAIVGEHEPAVELATLFEDGTIIKTIPLPSKDVWDRLRPGMTFHRRDRYFYQAADGNLGTVLQHHIQRVRDCHDSSGSQPVDLRSMRAHFAIRLRTARLINAKMWPQLSVAAALMMGIGLAAGAAVVFYIRARFGKNVSPHLVMALAMLASGIATIPLLSSIMWKVSPRLVRLYPSWRPPNAAELLEQAGAVPVRSLPDESEW